MNNDSCDSCDSCNFCDFCNSCDSCDFCKYCNSCKYCNFCDFCNSCENLVNGFMCINLKLKEKDNKKFWIFNKEVTREEWDNRFNIGKVKGGKNGKNNSKSVKTV